MSKLSPKGNPEPKKKTVFDTIRTVSSVRPMTYQRLREEGFPYEPFLVNRAFSLTEETVRMSALMNERSWIDTDMQATFYLHALRPKRRFEQWPKSLTNDETTTIARYYGMSIREARLQHHLHTTEQIAVMKEVLEQGARPSRYK